MLSTDMSHPSPPNGDLSKYPKITDGLLNGAINELKKFKIGYDVFKVNGSLEIPVQISILLNKKKYDIKN